MLHPIYSDPNLELLKTYLQENSNRSVFVLTDTQTQKYCLPVFKNKIEPGNNFQFINIQNGEEFKNLNTIVYIWKQLLNSGADRQSILINLGGGVVSDAGGFAASTFKRGIEYINVPTSLLAMVDAAIGGKTGINFEGIKNQIGVIRQASGVYIHPSFLETLPEKEILSGMAEMFKHGLIASPEHFYKLVKTKNLPSPEDIMDSVHIKLSVVEKDPGEKGLRQILNFGHTVGHALESFYRKKDIKITHGHAVALGMMVETIISNRLLGLATEEKNLIIETLQKFYPIPELQDVKNLEKEVIRLIRHDKKNVGHKNKFVLLEAIGKARYGITVPEELIRESLREIFQ